MDLIHGDLHQIRVSSSSQFIGLKSVNNHRGITILSILDPDTIHSTINISNDITDFEFGSHDQGLFILHHKGLSLHCFNSGKVIRDIFTAQNHRNISDIKGLRVHPGGKFVITFSEHSTKLSVWNVDQKCSSRSYHAPSPPTQVLFDSTGLYLVVACNDHNIYFIDWFSGQSIFKVWCQFMPILWFVMFLDKIY